MKQLAISKSMSLASLDTNFQKEEIKEVKKHVIYCVDISGSMYNDLPSLRDHLKNSIVINNDGLILSLVAFSGKNECYTILNHYHVDSLKDIQNVHALIDKYLQPLCLTAFLQPLESTKDLIEKSTEEMSHNLIFMTDGYNNDSPFSEVLEKLSELEPMVDSATFIEYGYYADGRSLEEMAEKVGGRKLFAKDFESYKVEINNTIQHNSSKRVLYPIENIKDQLLLPFIYSISDNGIIIYSTKYKKEISVDPSTEKLYFFIKNDKEIENEKFDDKELYSAAFALLTKNKFFDAENILTTMGDVRMINFMQGCYGKQKLEMMKNLLTKAIYKKECRFVDGKQKGMKADENRYCLVDLINDLSNDENNRFYPQHPDFVYNYTGRKTFVKVEGSVDSQIPEFTRQYDDNGYSLSNLVLNTERANISIQLKINGILTLPQNQFHIDSVNTFIYRNYTILKDGIVNVPTLPVKLTEKMKKKLTNKDVEFSTDENGISSINLYSLPIVNKRMVQNISAKTLANCELDLISVQSALKFLKDYFKEKNVTLETASKDSQFLKMYNGDQIEFLKSIGVTEYSGYTPKVGLEEGKDTYIACTLTCKVAKFSKIPKINDVRKKINENKKLTPSENAVKIEIDSFNNIVNNAIYEGISSKSKSELELSIAKRYYEDLNNKRKELLQIKAEIIFSLILTRSWFKEFSSMEENTLNVKASGDFDTTITFEFKEVEMEI